MRCRITLGRGLVGSGSYFFSKTTRNALGQILIKANLIGSCQEIGLVDIFGLRYCYSHLSVPIWLSTDMVVIPCRNRTYVCAENLIRIALSLRIRIRHRGNKINN